MIEKPGTALVVDRPEPMASQGEVLVRVARAGLCGTDLGTFLGKNPLVTLPARHRSRDCWHRGCNGRRCVDPARRHRGGHQPLQELRRLRRMSTRPAERLPQQPDAGSSAGRRACGAGGGARKPALHVGIARRRSSGARRALFDRHARGEARTRLRRTTAVLVIGCGGVGAGRGRGRGQSRRPRAGGRPR